MILVQPEFLLGNTIWNFMDIQEAKGSYFKRIVSLLELLNSPLKVVFEQDNKLTAQLVKELLGL